MKQPAKTDVAVLLIFFTRTDTLKRTFDVIKEARPSHLFFYQDGARNAEDAAKIEACRQLVADEQIDWECDIRRNYRTENAGAFASNFTAQKWAFSMYDKCVVIEDDSTPSSSFIPFCKEMLDRYENDERITMIAGYNFEEKTENAPYDYLFTTVFSIWGWASWSRVVGQWDETYSVVNDEFNVHQLDVVAKRHGYRHSLPKALRKHQQMGVPIYETVFWSYNILNSGLAIVPTRNMICNGGVSDEAAHYGNDLNVLPRRLRKMLTMRSYDLDFPLKHPKYVIENIEYKDRVFRIMAWNHPWIKIGRSFEELFYNLKSGNFKRIREAIGHRIRKLTGKVNYD